MRTVLERNTRRIVITAVAALPILGGAPAQASPRSAENRVQQTVSEGAGVSVTFDRRDRPRVTALRGTRSVYSRRAGRVVRSSSIAPARLSSATASGPGSGFACVRNRARRGFVAYKPVPVAVGDDETAYVRFVYHLYKQNRARTLRRGRGESDKYVSKQLEACTGGGGEAYRGYRLSRVVSMMTMKSSDRLIGQKWDSGEEEKRAGASLTFAVPIKPVTISATLNVNPVYKLFGGQGPDEQGPDEFDAYVDNQVNAGWRGASLFKFQGSTDYQGNVGHALWELPQRQRTPEINYAPTGSYFCGRVNTPISKACGEE